MNFGTAASDRILLVGFTVRSGSSGTAINTVTIGGITATQILNTRNTAGGFLSESAFYYAPVPTGTSGNVVITASANILFSGIQVWRITGMTGLRLEDSTAANLGDPSVVSVNTLVGSYVFAVGYANGATSQAWTGATETYDVYSGGMYGFSAASAQATAAESPRVVQTDYTGTINYHSSLAIALDGTPACNGVYLGGYCWYLGAFGQSCTTVCSSNGGYDTGTATYAGQAGTLAGCNSVLVALGQASGAINFSCSPGGPSGCILHSNSNRIRCNGVATTEAASDPSYRRTCACGN